MRVCEPQSERRISDLYFLGTIPLSAAERILLNASVGWSCSTYEDHFNVVALERLEKVCNPIFQTCSDENPFVEVIQKDGSEGSYVT